ncbi:MAG: PadR family transcriptional regulator [Chromatiales bacterium]|nr:PadR family transcriptional regulator [Chromatiales bacterium]
MHRLHPRPNAPWLFAMDIRQGPRRRVRRRPSCWPSSAEGDSYGYAIIKRVAELSGGELQWTDGMLYPVLHRLERQRPRRRRVWGGRSTGRQRKYYRLTDSGREELAKQRRQWQVVDADAAADARSRSFQPVPPGRLTVSQETEP